LADAQHPRRAVKAALNAWEAANLNQKFTLDPWQDYAIRDKLLPLKGERANG
jgi:hypothetical protein